MAPVPRDAAMVCTVRQKKAKCQLVTVAIGWSGVTRAALERALVSLLVAGARPSTRNLQNQLATLVIAHSAKSKPKKRRGV